MATFCQSSAWSLRQRFGQRALIELLDVERKDGESFPRQPIAFRRRLGNEREDDREQGEDRDDGEIKFPQLLFVDLPRELGQFFFVLGVAINRGPALLHFGQQMRRARRRDALRGEVTADVEIGRVLFFFDRLMLLPRLLHFLLLGAGAFVQGAIARFKFAPDAGDVFFHLRDGCFGGLQFFRGVAAGIGAPEPGLRHLGFLARQPRAFRAESVQLRLQIGRRRLGFLERGNFFQQLAIGGVVFRKTAIDGGEFLVAALGHRFCFVAPFRQRPLFFLEFGQRGDLLFRVFLPLRVDLLECFLDFCDPDRDLFLFLLEFS